MELTHLNKQGNAKMVDVGNKQVTRRIAVAEGFVEMLPDTLKKIKDGTIKKGDVLAVATVAGVNSAKQTFAMIPMCHNIFLSGVDIVFNYVSDTLLRIQATVICDGKTGVEMEALMAVSITALTIYDMCKAIDREIEIKNIRLTEKSGGNSGEYKRSKK